MTRVMQAYPLKLPQTPAFRRQVDWLRDLVLQASQRLLDQLWSDLWLGILASSKNKAYKVVGEKHVSLTCNELQLYLPSRIRRIIAEQVGRILRSQAERKDCYYEVLEVVQTTGVEGNLDSLVKTVAITLVKFHGKYYKRGIIRQILRTFRRYHYKFGLDFTILTQIPYTQIVKPNIHSVVLPYSVDDGFNGQVIKIEQSKQLLTVQLKLPVCHQPLHAKDWQWYEFRLKIPEKIYQRTQSSTSNLHLPSLRYMTLKSGLTLPFLEFAWSNNPEPLPPRNQNRIMATDLGLINLTTSVICEAGSQISPPIFWNPDKTILHKIEQFYHHISRIQKKLDRYPEQWLGQGKRFQERDRLYRKLNRYWKELLHLTSNQLLETANRWQCQTLVLEDLRTFEPPKNKRKLSRKLSTWLRGSLFEILIYKAKRAGITVKRVNSSWTSNYCPRCAQKGLKITEPILRKENKKGRFFHCPHCSFTADRDYIAAVNIYRMYQEQRKRRFSLKQAKPVSYTGTGIPLNCSSGASTPMVLGG